MPDPIAFMVMPFNRKPTGQTEKKVPSEVDFDALWERVYEPILEELGYRPVRADRDVGALIINQMIQRLAVADVVVADITLPNANVYYEIGVRHAAREKGCVLVGADWAQPVFDLKQMRALRFPLADGNVGKSAAKKALAALRKDLEALVKGVSPVFDAVPGFPQSDETRIAAFEDDIAELSKFDGEIRAVRIAPDAERKDRVRELLAKYAKPTAVRDLVWLELMELVRDNLGFQELLDYIDRLPKDLALHPLVLEQRALALSKAGDSPAAIGQLEELIATHGETSERFGLLGGRYKDLYRKAKKANERRRYLDLAIEAYQRGMEVDLNDFYPTSNLARLYRARGNPGDEQLAAEAAVAAKAACRAAIENGPTDEWTKATLLGIAFDQGDAPEAVRLGPQVEAEGAETWKLGATIDDLRTSVTNQGDPETRAVLQAVLDRLEPLLAD